MDKLKEYVFTAGRWLKSRNALTLAVGYGVGALTDDMLVGLIKAALSLF